MPDVIEVLRDADPVQLNRWSETSEGRATRDRVFRRSSRRPVWVALVAASVVLAIVAGVLVATRSTETSNRPATIVDRLAHGKWSKLSAGPARGLGDPSMVWTGEELLVYGKPKGAVGAVLAAFEPRSGKWSRRTAAASGSIAPVWTGTEWIVWNGIGPSDSVPASAVPGAAYHPTTESWRSIAVSPLAAAQGTVAVWTGSEVVVVGGLLCRDTGDCSDIPRAAAYNPTTDSWRLLPNADHPGGLLNAVWDGRRVVVWGFRSGGPATVAYEPDENRWIELPAATVQLEGAVLAVRGAPLWVGMQVGTLGGEPSAPGNPVRARVLDEQFGWRDLAPPLPEHFICPAVAAKVGRPVVALCGPGDRSAVLDLQNRWTTIPSPPTLARGVVWTGAELLALGRDKLMRFRPAR